MRVVALLVSAVLLASCDERQRTEAEHIAFMEEIWERPDGLPSAAFVRAGLDGGAWYDCSRDGDEIVCRAYGIANGALGFEQRFRLCLMAQELAELVGYPDYRQSSLGDVFSTRQRAVQLRSSGPPTVFESDGTVDRPLTEKAAMEYEAEASGTCPIPLPLGNLR